MTQAWRAPVFIDTTGDGDLGALAGCEWEIGEAKDCPCQPMSLNALTNACNQKSSRDPVLSLDAGAVQHAVNGLVAAKHVMVQNFGSRVDKYQQRFCNTQFAAIQVKRMVFEEVAHSHSPGELLVSERWSAAAKIMPLVREM